MAKQTTFKNRLKGMQEAWKTGKETPPGIPDSLYHMKLQSATLTESQSSGKMMIAREHLVLEGEFQGEVVKDYLHLESESGPRRVAQWIEQMGYEVPEDVATLEEVVAAIATDAPTYTAQVKANGDFKNVNIREVESAGEASEATEAEAGGGEDTGNGTFEVGDKVTFTDDDQNEVSGSVVKVKGNTAKVMDSEDNEWEVPISDLTAAEEETPAPTAPTKTVKKVTEAAKKDEGFEELKAFAESQDIEVPDEDDTDSVTTKIKEYEWNRKELTEDEAKLLESIGAIEPKKAAAPAKKAVKKATKK